MKKLIRIKVFFNYVSIIQEDVNSWIKLNEDKIEILQIDYSEPIKVDDNFVIMVIITYLTEG